MIDYTGEVELAKVVIDLDTVMPGSVLYDFGDMVRIAACPSREDEKDKSKVRCDLSLFESLTKGFLEPTRDFLNKKEIEYMALSGQILAFELGTRFLRDYLENDWYFPSPKKGQNLEKARNQFKLTIDMQNKREQMEKIVQNLR
jgi:hypothetical protein